MGFQRSKTATVDEPEPLCHPVVRRALPLRLPSHAPDFAQDFPRATSIIALELIHGFLIHLCLHLPPSSVQETFNHCLENERE